MSAFEQSAGRDSTDPRADTGTPNVAHVRHLPDSRRELERVLACVLETIAADLARAHQLLVEVDATSGASDGAAALVAQAGALADRTIAALGGFPVNGSAADWHLGQVTRDALAMLEQRRAGGVQ